MDTPKYTATIIVGGTEQTTKFDALPAPTGSANDGIITKQSGMLELTFVDKDNNPYDLTGATTIETEVIPFNSDVVVVSLGTGSVLANVYTVTWVRDVIPSAWSQFAQDRFGAIVMTVKLQETGTTDYFQTYTRFNVFDGDFRGDQSTTPIEFRYDWIDAIASEWVKYNRGTPLELTDALNYLSAAGKNDWGTVISQTEVTSPVGVDNAQYIIAGLGGLWSGFAIGDIVRFSATDSIWYSNPPTDGYLAYDLDTATQLIYKSAAWVDILGTGFGDVFGPAGAIDDNIAAFDTASGKLIKDSGISNVNLAGSITKTDFLTVTQAVDLDTMETDVAANNAKVTNATHTGDVTGATALTLASVAITGQTTVTAVGADFVLLSDTDDSGNLKKALVSDFGGGGAGIAPNWTFDTDVTATDPTAGGIKYNNATPASVTAIHVNIASNNTADFEVLISALGSGDTLYLQQLDDDANFIVFNVTSSVDNTGWYTINGTIADSGSLPTNASDLGVNFSYTSGGAGASVTSVFGRTGAVVAVAGDYDASEITDLQKTVAAGNDNNQTGTAYTLVLADEENKTVFMNNAASNTLTIPLNASVAFPIGTKINIIMEGVGVTTVEGDTGVTVNGVSAGSGDINNQYQGVTLTKRSTDTWFATGDIGTVA